MMMTMIMKMTFEQTHLLFQWCWTCHSRHHKNCILYDIISVLCLCLTDKSFILYESNRDI